MPSDRPSSVLIVEDNWLLAIQTEAWLEEDGIACAGTAANVQSALALAREQRPEFALVHFNLGGELAGDLIETLIKTGTKVIVMTGYSDIGAVQGVCSMLHKPCTKDQVITALAGAGLVH